MRTRTITTAVAAVAALALPTAGALAAPPAAFPDVVALPTEGFAPEGIAIGGQPIAYAGSLADGDVVAVDLRTGELTTLLDRDDSAAVGLALDEGGRTLFAAGGPTAQLSFVDTTTGAVDEVALPGATFANDVAVTDDAVYVTDSFTPTIFRVDRDTRAVTPLTVDGVEFVAGAFNLNGVQAAPGGEVLLAINTTTGELLRIDVADVADDATVQATVVDTGDVELTAGDGLLLRGRTLVVVRNQANTVTTLRLAGDLTSATLVEETTQDSFAVPTTAARFGGTVYVVNARFGQNGPAGTPVASEIVAVD